MRASTGGRWERRLSRLVVLVALHSAGVGVLLLFTPAWAASFAGWTVEVQPLFFVRQAGVFHFVVVFAYLWEWFRHRSVAILVTTKTLAFLFLMSAWLLSVTHVQEAAWSVPFSGIADGLMGLAVWGLHRRWKTHPAG